MNELPASGIEPELRMVIFAGPNGSGKSSITTKLQSTENFPGIYINADDIARDELNHISDAMQRNVAAANLAEQRRKDALNSGQSFAFETVMSTPGKLAIFQEAKEKGFQVELAFVTTREADINVSRVANRATLGGHPVEPDKTRERYGRVMQLLPSAVDMADNADVFDNSGTRLLHVAVKRSRILTLVNEDRAPAWVIERLATPCRERLQSREQLEATFERIVAADPATRSVFKDASISHGKTYTGPILDVTKHHALQKAGVNLYVVHDQALCPPVSLEKGKTAMIAYQYEDGGKHAKQQTLAPIRDIGRDIGRER